MSENSSADKSEQPTPTRLRKAKEEGQVPHSRDFVSGIMLVLGLLTLMGTGPEIAAKLASLYSQNLVVSPQELESPDLMSRHLKSTMTLMCVIAAGIILVIFLGAFVAASLPQGPSFSSKKLQPKFSRLSPKQGLGKVFSMNSLVELVKAIIKAGLLLSIMVIYLNQISDQLPLLSRYQSGDAIAKGLTLLGEGVLYLAIATLVIGLLDMPYQVWQNNKKLKMTKQEVKDEHKQREGKPEVKAKIRQIQQQMSRSRAEVALPQADVLLVNPTHYAVALKYDRQRAEAPFVLAKGQDEVALYMRSIAPKYDLEIVSVPALTRAIYHSTRIEQQIPPALYQAIAQVLTYVMQLKAFRQGKQSAPGPLPHFSIPDHLRFD